MCLVSAAVVLNIRLVGWLFLGFCFLVNWIEWPYFLLQCEIIVLNCLVVIKSIVLVVFYCQIGDLWEWFSWSSMSIQLFCCVVKCHFCVAIVFKTHRNLPEKKQTINQRSLNRTVIICGNAPKFSSVPESQKKNSIQKFGFFCKVCLIRSIVIKKIDVKKNVKMFALWH